LPGFAIYADEKRLTGKTGWFFVQAAQPRE
jgi:hypothetical protein